MHQVQINWKILSLIIAEYEYAHVIVLVDNVQWFSGVLVK